MMEQDTTKLSWVELKQAVAKKAGVSEKTAGMFLNTLVSETTALLEQGEQVRIARIGTFRIQTVAPRRSVNVTTGTSMVIPGYNKIGFAPDNGVTNLLNAPPALLPQEETPMQKLNEQANEILGILTDMGQSPDKYGDDTETTRRRDEDETETTRRRDEDETETEAGKEPEKEQEKAPAEEPKEEPAETPKEEPKETPEEEPKEDPGKAPEEEPEQQKPEENVQQAPRDDRQESKPFRPWMTIGITMIIFAILLIFAYIFLQHKIEQWVDTISNRTEHLQQVETDGENDNWSLTDAEDFQASGEADELQAEAAPRVYTRFITTEKLPAGSRLAWLAYKYYGNKDLWVFIYEANKDRLKNPSRILIGTKVRVPVLDDNLKDTSNPETQRIIRQLEQEYLQLNR